MTDLPLHPQFVHLPLALALILPILAIILAFLIKSEKFSPQVWTIIVGLQLVATISGYVAMSLGENEEEVVEKIVGKEALHRHEEHAEMFVASTVAATVFSGTVLFVKLAVKFPLMLVSFVLMLGQLFLGVRSGQSGGALVYVHQAAAAYSQNESSSKPQGLLPTPGMNTSESEYPQDDNDYAPGEAVEEDENEEVREDD